MSITAPINIDALPQTINMKLYIGDDFFMELPVADKDGNPVDLAGYVAASQVRTNANAVDIAATIDCEIDVPQSTVYVHLRSSEAMGLPGSGVWDLQIDGPRLLTLAAGTVTGVARVTRTSGTVPG